MSTTSASLPRKPATPVLWGAAAAYGSGRALPAVPRIGRVVVIVFENKGRDRILGNADAPTFAKLARRGATLTNYRAVAHPSLPNYLALVSGSTQGITDDCTSCFVTGRSLADTLEVSGRTWKTYAEGLPSAGFTGPYSGRY